MSMTEQIRDLRAKDEAAYELVREILVSARIGGNHIRTIERFLNDLLGGGDRRRSQAIDLNAVFRFVLFGRHLLVIPKRRFGDNDLLVLKNFQGRFDFDPERIEFKNGSFEADPNVFLPGYVRLCFRRGLHREFLED